MTWVTLDQDDTIKDEYKSDGTKTVTVIHDSAEYSTTNATLVEGFERAKANRAAGGTSVTIEADLNDASESIDAMRYSMPG